MKKFVKNRGLAFFLLLILLIFNNIENISAKSNDTIIDKNLQIELRTSYGFMICHHKEMKIFKSHFPLFEISVQHATFGRKSWQSKSNYPAVGVSFIYTGLGGLPQIGRAFAMTPYISFNLLKSRKNQLNTRLGVGLGYLTEKFDAKENPKNTFIGSNLNAAINISLEYNRFITNRLSLSAFVGFTHFSNGAKRAPNNGINIAHAGLSAKYFINEPKQRIPKQSLDNQQYKSWSMKNISVYAAFLYSMKDIDEYMGYGKTWSVYNLQVNVLKRFTEMSKAGIGFDLVYDMTDRDVLKIKGIEFDDIEILKPGINAVYEVALGSTSFIFNIGWHISGKEMGEGRFYQKLGVMQNIGRHIFATAALTTHFGWADYVGFGIGYRLH